MSVRVRIVALCVAEEDYESHIASVLQSPAAVIFKVRMCWRRSHCDSAPCVLGFLPMITCCTAGKWGAGTAACTSCDVGTFSIAAASACTQCAAGTWSNLTGTATACPACPGQSLRYRRVGVHLAGAFPPISSVSCVVCRVCAIALCLLQRGSSVPALARVPAVPRVSPHQAVAPCVRRVLLVSTPPPSERCAQRV